MESERKKSKKGYRFVKRLLDILLSILGLLITSWLIILVALINLFFSRGRPFYFDKRVGINGKDISIIKFTSMKPDAEENVLGYLSNEQLEEWEWERKITDDPRVTPFGKILRKTSIDELPQLFNILIGSMSFIGPRPIIRWELEKHYTEEEQKKLLSVRPGLVGNWVVNGRNTVRYKDGRRQKLELDYVERFSFKMDISILFKAVAAIFRFDEAK